MDTSQTTVQVKVKGATEAAKKLLKAAQDLAKKGAIQNVTIVAANTQYPIVIPKGTRSITAQLRTGADFKLGLATGHVDTASPPGPYFTVKSGTVLKLDGLDLSGKTIYVAGGAGTIVEIVCYSKN